MVWPEPVSSRTSSVIRCNRSRSRTPETVEPPFANGRSAASGRIRSQTATVADPRVQRDPPACRDRKLYTVDVLPRVDVTGRVGGEAVDATFAPVLSFDAGDLRLQPNLEGAEGVGPFAPREPGSETRVVPAEVSLGALSLSVATARRVVLLGIAALLLLGGLALASGRRRQGGDEHERILARYGQLLLPVSSHSGSWEHVIELADMEALVRLAEHQGKLILHVVEGSDRSYVVEDGSTVYRYEVHPSEPVAAIVWPPPARDLRARR